MVRVITVHPGSILLTLRERRRRVQISYNEENSFDTFERAAKASRAAYATSSSPGLEAGVDV